MLSRVNFNSSIFFCFLIFFSPYVIQLWIDFEMENDSSWTLNLLVNHSIISSLMIKTMMMEIEEVKGASLNQNFNWTETMFLKFILWATWRWFLELIIYRRSFQRIGLWNLMFFSLFQFSKIYCEKIKTISENILLNTLPTESFLLFLLCDNFGLFAPYVAIWVWLNTKFSFLFNKNIAKGPIHVHSISFGINQQQ